MTRYHVRQCYLVRAARIGTTGFTLEFWGEGRRAAVHLDWYMLKFVARELWKVWRERRRALEVEVAVTENMLEGKGN